MATNAFGFSQKNAIGSIISKYPSFGAITFAGLSSPSLLIPILASSDQRTIFNLGRDFCSLSTPASVTMVPLRTSV